VEILARGMREGPPSLRTIRPDAPAGPRRDLARAMAKLPGDRHQTNGELIADLRPHVARADRHDVDREIGQLARRPFTDEARED